MGICSEWHHLLPRLLATQDNIGSIQMMRRKAHNAALLLATEQQQPALRQSAQLCVANMPNYETITT